MQRGFLSSSRQGSTSDKDHPACESEHVARVRRELAAAEQELRCRRKARLQSPPAQLPQPQPPQPQLQQLQQLQRLETEAFEALAAQQEPSESVHRLAECLVLLLSARQLVELGNHPLPGRVPWRNLKLLLQKSFEPEEAAEGITAALAQQPFGPRLAEHARERLLGGVAPVLREQVAAVDSSFADLFDFVSFFVCGEGKAPESPACVGQGEELVAAVAEQEREVARLRKLLRQAEDSDLAARAFASEHSPSTGSQGEATRVHGALGAAASQASGSEETFPLPHRSVACRRSIQYRMNEVAVPPLQEPVLISLVRSVTNQRESCVALSVDVLGDADDREEPGTALKRAEAVRDWLVDCGLAASRLRVSVASEGEGEHKGIRQVLLRIMDDNDAQAAVRQRSQELMARLLSGDATAIEDSGCIEELSPAPVGASGTSLASSADIGNVSGSAAPPVEAHAKASATSEAIEARSEQQGPSVRIEMGPNGPNARGLQLIFSGPGLQEAALDVAEGAVRLVSLSKAWPDLAVPLPFPVEAPEAGNRARFSRRAGTLTVRLRAAEGGA